MAFFTLAINLASRDFGRLPTSIGVTRRVVFVPQFWPTTRHLGGSGFFVGESRQSELPAKSGVPKWVVFLVKWVVWGSSTRIQETAYSHPYFELYNIVLRLPKSIKFSGGAAAPRPPALDNSASPAALNCPTKQSTPRFSRIHPGAGWSHQHFRFEHSDILPHTTENNPPRCGVESRGGVAPPRGFPAV